MNFPEIIQESLEKHFLSVDGLTIYDCGCGDGSNSLPLARAGAVVYAVDLRPENTHRLDELAKPENISLYVGAYNIALSQPFPIHSFSVVLYTNVHHFVKPELKDKALEGILTSLDRNGILVLSDLEDDKPLPPKLLEWFDFHFVCLENKHLTIKDEPHKGANYPHQHKIHYLVGKLKAA